MSTSSTPHDSAKQPAFDAVAAGAEIDREYERWQQARKVAKRNIEVQRSIKRNFIKLLQQAHHNAPNFKEFVEKHTHVARSTAYRLLGIEEGRGDEIRQQERDRQDQHRSKPVSVTKPVTDTPIARAPGLKAWHGEPDSTGNDDPEKSAADRKAANAALDKPAASSGSGDTTQVKRGSQEHWLSEFRIACEQYLPKMEEATRAKAKEYVMTWQPKRHLKVVA